MVLDFQFQGINFFVYNYKVLLVWEESFSKPPTGFYRLHPGKKKNGWKTKIMEVWFDDFPFIVGGFPDTFHVHPLFREDSHFDSYF